MKLFHKTREHDQWTQVALDYAATGYSSFVHDSHYGMFTWVHADGQPAYLYLTTDYISVTLNDPGYTTVRGKPFIIQNYPYYVFGAHLWRDDFWDRRYIKFRVTNGVTWWTNDRYFDNTNACPALNGGYYGSGMYVVFGDDGFIVTSTDLSSWTTRTSGTSEDLLYGCFSGTNHIILASGGHIYTSPTGATWTSRTSGVSGVFLGIKMIGTRCYAWGGITTDGATSGFLIYSDDNGATWAAISCSAFSTACVVGISKDSSGEYIVYLYEYISTKYGKACTSYNLTTWFTYVLPNPISNMGPDGSFNNGEEFVRFGGYYYLSGAHTYERVMAERSSPT